MTVKYKKTAIRRFFCAGYLICVIVVGLFGCFIKSIFIILAGYAEFFFNPAVVMFPYKETWRHRNHNAEHQSGTGIFGWHPGGDPVLASGAVDYPVISDKKQQTKSCCAVMQQFLMGAVSRRI